jgi:membrane-associated HD superfamily phosphohydrolase
MIKLRDFLRSLLRGWLERLDSQVEQKSARAKKERWYRKEFFLPPVIIAIVTPVILFGVLILNWALSISQIIFLAIFVLVLHGLLLVYLNRDQKNLVSNDDAMALLSVIFFITLIAIKVVSVYSLKYIWISPFLTPVSVAALLITLLLNARLAMVMSFLISLVFGLLNGFSLPIVMVGAFGEVQRALSWLVDAYVRVAGWRASYTRASHDTACEDI